MPKFIVKIAGIIVAGAAIAVTAPAFAQSAETEEGFIPLFNGVDLEGWKVSAQNPGSFSVEDGMLVARGGPAHLFYDGPVADGDFEDFELRLQVRTTPGSNSGVYFHTAWQAEDWPADGHEAQVNTTHTDPRKTGSLYGVVDLYAPGPDEEPFAVKYDDGSIYSWREAAPSHDGEWFDYTIRVEGKTVTTKVDGETLVVWTEPEDWAHEDRIIDHGTFALQAHDPDSEVHYKNIRVRVLD